jgi:hypothetical protein
MIALARFKFAAYARSHRIFQAALPMLVLLSLLYATRAAPGGEAAALTDSAVTIIPVLAWAARGLLDTEPDEQRLVSATAAGGPSRESRAGLAAALLLTAVFAAVALGAGLLIGLSAAPPLPVLAAAVALHGCAVLTGTALGALTSRAILRSPAVSIMTLVLGFLAILLVSASPLAWLTVPLLAWNRAANAGELTAGLPGLLLPALAWTLIGLAVYLRLRRTRP